MANPILKLGLPKGSLEDPTIDLFDRAGWKVRKHPRNYFPDINDPEITARLCRVQEIPLYIQDGVLDLGLTGKDWVKETKADVVVVSDLIYSKVSNKPARWVLAVADDSPYQKPEDLAGKRIATELMGVCTEYFKERNIPVNINYSWGATEAKVVEGLADAIVEVTETETTIRAHDLRVIDEVLVTNTVLIANAAAMQDPEKRRKIEQIDLLLQGALRAESLVCLKMNAPAAKLEAVGLRPDVVTVDPPRKGLAPEVIASVAAMGPEKVVYVSCDPATLGRDVKIFGQLGYKAVRAAAVDMFPGTAHVETVVLLSRETNPLTVEVRMEVETGEVKEHPTYKRIQEYVQEKYGFKVHTAYIAEVKRMVGLDMHKAPNAVEQRKHEYHPCPPEKVEAIKDALRHFGLIAE